MFKDNREQTEKYYHKIYTNLSKIYENITVAVIPQKNDKPVGIKFASSKDAKECCTHYNQYCYNQEISHAIAKANENVLRLNPLYLEPFESFTNKFTKQPAPIVTQQIHIPQAKPQGLKGFPTRKELPSEKEIEDLIKCMGGQDFNKNPIKITNVKVKFEKDNTNPNLIFSIKLTFNDQKQARAFCEKYKEISGHQNGQRHTIGLGLFLQKKNTIDVRMVNSTNSLGAKDNKAIFLKTIKKGAKDLLNKTKEKHNENTPLLDTIKNDPKAALAEKAKSLRTTLGKEEKNLRNCKGFLKLFCCGWLLNSKINGKVDKMNTLSTMYNCLTQPDINLIVPKQYMLLQARKGFFSHRTRDLLNEWNNVCPNKSYPIK